ncbi:MAG: CaiB/BaiF CoA transferase family protein [Acidimicrobiales bacterium]
MSTRSGDGPLDGVRIIDFSQVASGPVGSAMLADQGADVIKVEEPRIGDRSRPLASFSKGGMNALFVNCNRGKRSVCLDLDDERGREIARALIDTADVVLSNFRPGVMKRLGLGHEELRATNRRLITVEISGYGLKGPMADRPVFDPVIQAITGHVAVQVNPQIPFPDLVRHAVVDKATACYAAQAICAALFRRERSGEGQHIELSMLDASLNFLWTDGMMGHTLLDSDVKAGPTIAQTYSLTRCADGELVYFTGTLEQRLGLFRAAGHPEWCDDERFNTHASVANAGNYATLGAMLTAAFEALRVADAYQALVDNDVPCGMVTGLADVPSQVQVVANESLVEFDHAVVGRVRQPLPPARFHGTPCAPRLTFPALGEHTVEVLTELGIEAGDATEPS